MSSLIVATEGNARFYSIWPTDCQKNTKALSNDSLIIKQTLVNVDLPIEK